MRYKRVEKKRKGRRVTIHLFKINGFSKKNELRKNNRWGNSNLSHLVETNTAIAGLSAKSKVPNLFIIKMLKQVNEPVILEAGVCKARGKGHNNTKCK